MISVIIPTLNEESNIGRCISALQAETCPLEVIVADGGSDDRTVEAARRLGATVVASHRGRGVQMNEGAGAAGGDMLLFLHADTELEGGWSLQMRETLAGGSSVGGAFRFCLDACGFKYRLVEYWVKLRCGILSLPYGDQGIFMARETFHRLEGFSEIPLMEDVDMVERMKKLGRVAMLPARARTHARRWKTNGVVRTSISNQKIMLLYRLGVDPDRLAKIYYGER